MPPLTEEDVIDRNLTTEEQAAEEDALDVFYATAGLRARANAAVIDAMESEAVPETERAALSNEQLLVVQVGVLQDQLRRVNTVLTTIMKTVGEVFVHEATVPDGKDEVHAEKVGTAMRYWHARVGE